MTRTLRIDGDSRSVVVFEEIKSNHTFGPMSAPNSDFFWISLPFLEDTRNPKYDNLLIDIHTEFEMCFIAEENFV